MKQLNLIRKAYEMNATLFFCLMAIGLFLSQQPAKASIYYIDYNLGSDTNNGTTAATPWQHHPFMKGWTGSYHHSAGDQFWFQTNTTWPASCFPLYSQYGYGGNSSSNDYYGVNPNLTGTNWVYPIFDGAGATVNSMGGCFWKLYAQYVTVNGITFSNQNFVGNGSTNFIIYSAYGYDVFTNLTFCNTYHLGGTNDTYLMDAIYSYPGLPGQRITHCTFTGLPTNAACMAALYNGITVDNNTITYTANGIDGEFQYVSNNTLAFIQQPYDSLYNTYDHNDVLYFKPFPNATNICAYNVLRDNAFGELIYPTLEAIPSNSTTTIYIYCNLVEVSSDVVGPAILLDPACGANGAGTRGTAYIFNNTLQATNGMAYIRVAARTGTDWAVVNVTNNFFIGETKVGLVPDPGVPTLCNVGFNLTNSNVAAALAGYTPGNNYQPTLLTSPTVGAGKNLSALNIFTVDLLGNPFPTTGTWAAGAYQLAVPALPVPSGFRFLQQ